MSQLRQQRVSSSTNLVKSRRGEVRRACSAASVPPRGFSPPVGFERAEHLLDFEVGVLELRSNRARLVVVKDAKFAKTAHVRLLGLPPGEFIVLLDDLAKRLHVETHVRLEHVHPAIRLGHRASKQTRVVARLIDRRLVCERRSVRRDNRRADAAQKTGGDAFGRSRVLRTAETPGGGGSPRRPHRLGARAFGDPSLARLLHDPSRLGA